MLLRIPRAYACLIVCPPEMRKNGGWVQYVYILCSEARDDVALSIYCLLSLYLNPVLYHNRFFLLLLVKLVILTQSSHQWMDSFFDEIQNGRYILHKNKIVLLLYFSQK